jgi:hypothetical protein
MSLARWDIINFFIEKNNYKSYLEIGYYKGWSFDRIKCEMKTAVDPNPCKIPEQEKTKRGEIIEDEFGTIHKLTSDEFFFAKDVVDNRLRLAHENNNLLYEIPKYEIIFVDGSHEYSQVMKDIGNSLRNLSDDGVIIMHDCNPPKYEHTTDGIDGCWNGTVYKAAIELQAYYSNIDFYTIDTDWGIGVIKKIAQKDNEKIRAEGRWMPFHVMKYDGSWSYFNMHRKELLNLVDITTFLSRERSSKVTILQ